LLLREKNHPKITPEIRRELFSTRCRGEDAFSMDVVEGDTGDNTEPDL